MKRYEPIRKFIHLTDNRNSNLSVTNLVGLTIEKRYIPSVANVIGTDLSKYKVIKQGQFACSLMQVSRDGKMPVAMYKGEPSIMSPAYPIFEVNDENELMPEYLHMYLSRPEFDREAVFRAVGGVRGSLDWEDFLDMKMPIPSIEEQRKIVAEYQAVEQRIENNNRLIKALEDTAQAIYHHTFVENIDPENLPEGWRWGTLADIAECHDSKRVPIAEYDRINMKGEYPYYGASSIMDYVNDYLFDGTFLLMGEDGTVRTKENYPVLQYVCGKIWVNNHAHVLTGINGYTTELLYVLLAKTNIGKFVTGGVQEKINQKNMFSIPVLILPDKDIVRINNKIVPLINNITIINNENVMNEKLIQVLLSKLS